MGNLCDDISFKVVDSVVTFSRRAYRCTQRQYIEGCNKLRGVVIVHISRQFFYGRHVRGRIIVSKAVFILNL